MGPDSKESFFRTQEEMLKVGITMQPDKMWYKICRIKVTKKLSLYSCVEDQTYGCLVSNILSISSGKVVRGEGPESWGRGDSSSVLSPRSCQFTS